MSGCAECDPEADKSDCSSGCISDAPSPTYVEDDPTIAHVPATIEGY